MNVADLNCREERRREDVRVAKLFGLDYVEVDEQQGDQGQRTLYVHFLGKAPQKFEKSNLVLTGGRRIRDVQITGIRVNRLPDPTLDDYLEVKVDKPGDFSTYTLSAVEVDAQGNPTGQPMEGFDPRYDHVDFSFKAGCPSDLDCKPQNVCPPPVRPQPEINYLAKDYESFRQLILDRLALIMPGWNETHVPDIGITLVELLAYVGDYLSYYQDAVATEAYLETARERISVRRHARLVDYFMHEGCNSRAWITIWTSIDRQLDSSQIFFITPFPNAPASHILTSDDLLNVPAASYEVFEPLPVNDSQTISIYVAHNEILFYTWGDCQCCLAIGATSATLVDRWVPSSSTPPGGTPAPTGPTPSSPPPSPALRSAAIPATDGPVGTVRALQLQVGDILIFEEVKGPKTGNPADADPKHRQAVRLTRVTPAIDPLYHPYGPNFGQPIVEIEWDTEDALTFPLCISALSPPPDCKCMEDVSVARGNVVLVDNGGHTSESLGCVPTRSTAQKCSTCCEPASVEVFPGLYRPVLTQKPLTFSEPLPPPCSADDFIAQDPRQALPWISLVSIPPEPACSSAALSPPAVLPQPEDASPPKAVATPVPQPSCKVKSLFAFSDLDDPTSLAGRLLHPADVASQFLLAQLSLSTRKLLSGWDGSSPIPSPLRMALISDLTGLLETWLPRLDLLESGPDDRNFVVEIDNEGFGHLRFGNGVLGRQPQAGMAFRATYRVGNGKSGNVGAETITCIVFRKEKLSGVNLAPRNPLPATGGTEPELIEDVKQFAPFAFRSVLERAITADDYAAVAEDNDRRLQLRSTLAAADPGICASPFRRLQQAKASLRWTGSWYTMLVALDPAGTEDAAPALIDEISLYLDPFRRVGYDLLVAPARYVPLSVALTVCVLPNYLRGHVEAAVLDVLSNRVLPNGRTGFFHPDNLSFGDGIFASRLLAAVQAVPGVQNVKLTELERFEISEPEHDVAGEELPPNSVLTLGPMEIARLDNDPDFPENGRLVLDVRGGR